MFCLAILSHFPCLILFVRRLLVSNSIALGSMPSWDTLRSIEKCANAIQTIVRRFIGCAKINRQQIRQHQARTYTTIVNILKMCEQNAVEPSRNISEIFILRPKYWNEPFGFVGDCR